MTDEPPAPLPHPTRPASENAKPRPRLPRWPVPVMAVLVSAATVAVLVMLWRWTDGLALADVEKRATAQLDALKLAASVVVGGGGLFALYLAARRQRTQEMELDARHAELAQRDRVQAHVEQVAETNRLHAERVAEDARGHAEAQRITELYTKASEQLGSEKAPVRLAGLYALERLAQDNRHQRQTMVNVLCAYLRMPYALPGDPPAEDADEQIRVRYEERVQEREVRLTAQRVLAAHLRPGADSEDPAETFWSSIDLDLSDATLINFEFHESKTQTAIFDRAVFVGVTLFMAANFNLAKFEGAKFREVRFDGARFTLATFRQVKFEGGASFRFASFTGRGGSLEGALFQEAEFGGYASFGDVRFAGGANFRRAKFVDGVDFSGSLVARSVFGRSDWPVGWRIAVEPAPIEGEEGSWYPLVRGDADSLRNNED